MSHGRVNALLVTPPHSNGPVTFLNQQAPDTGATLRRLPSGLEIDLKNDPDTNFLLIFNLRADTIKIDGQLLPKITDGKPESMTPGWYVDSQTNRTVIKLRVQPNGHAAFSPPTASCHIEIQEAL